MVNWSSGLNRKYDILQQQADTAAAGQRAQAEVQAAAAGQTRAQTQYLPMDATARRDLMGAQAGNYTAMAANTNAQTPFVGRLAQAQIDTAEANNAATTAGVFDRSLAVNQPLIGSNTQAAAANMIAGAGGVAAAGTAGRYAGSGVSPSNNTAAAFLNQGVKVAGSPGFYANNPGLDPMTGLANYENLYNKKTQDAERGYLYRKGIARVPGKGDGTQDTVHAKLAPGEAVLNKSAAEGMGRGLIEMLNRKGAQKMGMV